MSKNSASGAPPDLQVLEALRSAQELIAYLWNNTDASRPEAGNVELVAHSDRHAEQVAALLNDARMQVDAALHGLEASAAEPMADPDFDDCTDAFNGWIWQAYRFSEPATFTLHNMAVAFRAGAEWKAARTGQTELVRDLLKMWPDVRVLVDGFTVNSAWNNEWDAQVRQRMIDFGMKHLFPLVFPPKTEERKC